MEEDLGIIIEDKGLVLWRDTLKRAEAELAKIEQGYFEGKTLNEAIIELCKNKVASYGTN